MKTFVELITEVRQSIDQEDNKVLANIEDSIESTTVATSSHALGSYLIYDKKVYEVTTAISVGDTLVIYPATGYNIKVADDIMTMLKDEAATRSALGAKNILPFDLDDIKALNTNGTWAGNIYSYRGVDFTVNSDGTISATGTATGGNASIKIFAASSNYEMLGKEVILSGCPSGGSTSTYRIQAYRMASADGSTGTYFDDGTGTDAFTALNNASGTVGSFAVAVYENETVTNLLFKPMVRLSSDSDDTYQPYAKTNQELTEETNAIESEISDAVNVLGAKNLLPNEGTTQTVRGITFTVNADGSVTADGTAESGSNPYIKLTENFTVPRSGQYIVSGNPIEGDVVSGNWTTVIYLYDITSGVNHNFDSTGDEQYYFDSTHVYRISTYVKAGETVSDVRFYPMIRFASIADDTYVPYSMTNQELTENLTSLIKTKGFSKTITVTANSSTGGGITDDVSLSGYTAIGIIGCEVTNTNLAISRSSLDVNNQRANIVIHNFLSSDITSNISYLVLYKKNI